MDSPSNQNDTPDTHETHLPQPQPKTNSNSDALSKALSTSLSTVIKDFDLKAQSALQSQERLTSAIDRLTQELDQLLEDAPGPFIMQHAAKISGVRKRVSLLNSLLRSIQERIDNVDRMLMAGSSEEKVATKSS